MPLEKAREDKRAAAWLKTNILLHAYLNNLPVTPAHQAAQQAQETEKETEEKKETEEANNSE